MEEHDKQERREDIFSNAVRAGKRTYFFDVKATKSDQYYLTITESKRRFNAEQGKFFYEKHKVFLYQEDFEKFSKGLQSAIGFISSKQKPVERESHKETVMVEETKSVDISFEDLGKEEVKPVE
jgi:hypothetical protein